MSDHFDLRDLRYFEAIADAGHVGHPARAMPLATSGSLPSAGARIGVSVKTIRRRIAEGVLPVYRCGRILRLDPDDVDAMFTRYPQWTASEFSATGRRRAPGVIATSGCSSHQGDV